MMGPILCFPHEMLFIATLADIEFLVVKMVPSERVPKLLVFLVFKSTEHENLTAH